MQHSIAARFAAWPARYVHPAATARERRLGLRPSSAFIAASGRRTVLRRPDVGPLTALRAPWRALTIEPVREAAAAGPRRPSGCGGPAPPVPEDRAAPPWRPRGPPEAGHSHLCRWHRHPVHRRHPRARGRQAPARTRRRHLDPAQGHARRGRDDRGDGHPRGQRGDRPRGQDRPAVRLHRVLVRHGRDAHQQDRPLLPDGPDGRRPRAPRPRVRRGALDLVRRGVDAADVRDRAGPRRARRRRRARRARSRCRPEQDRCDDRGHDAAAQPAARPPRGAGREDRRVRRLADADPVRRHPRGAPRRPVGGRAVRPVAHGRARRRGSGRRRRAGGRARHRPAGARDRAGALLDDLRRRRRDPRRPDRLPAGRGPVHGRRQRVERAGRLGRARRADRGLPRRARRPVAGDRPRRRSRVRARSTSWGR